MQREDVKQGSSKNESNMLIKEDNEDESEILIHEMDGSKYQQNYEQYQQQLDQFQVSLQELKQLKDQITKQTQIEKPKIRIDLSKLPNEDGS